MSKRKRKFSKKVEPIFDFIGVPIRREIDGVKKYIWDGFEVRITHKNNAVFSNKKNEKGRMFPYGGIEITRDEFVSIKHDRQLLRWMVEGFIVNGRPQTYLDGNPDPCGCSVSVF